VSSIYPRIDEWVIPSAALTATLNGVASSALSGNESGAFWLGTRSGVARITDVVLPKGRGVEERPYHWRVSPEVFGAISRWAKPRELILLGIAHTHGEGVPALLSKQDRRQSLHVSGILAVVIGNGGLDCEHEKWGWYVYEGDDYRQILPPELFRRVQREVCGRAEVWRADGDGVWPLK
jgi:hypothetical protein